MNKRYFIFTRKAPSQELMALVLTVLFFAVGCVVGTASASYITENSVVPNFISDILGINLDASISYPHIAECGE